MKMSLSSKLSFTGAILAAMIQMQSVAIASPTDVRPQKFVHGSRYVRVVPRVNQRVTFEDCKKGMEQNTCVPIGRNIGYTLAELRRQRNNQYVDVGAAVVYDIAIIVLTTLTYGTATGMAAEAWMGHALYSTGLKVVGTGAAIGAVATTAKIAENFQRLNPYEQAKIAGTIENDVTLDQTVIEDDIPLFIERLKVALERAECRFFSLPSLTDSMGLDDWGFAC